MKKTTFWIFWTAAVLCVLFFLPNNCSLLKPKYDPVAHQYAVNIQKEALALMDRAKEPFSLHREAIYRLMTRVEKAYEYARLLYRNDKVTRVWDVLRSTEANRLGQFMLEWEKEGILPALYIEDTKKMVMENFKKLVELEEGKKK